jgi:hypothetical protein
VRKQPFQGVVGIRRGRELGLRATVTIEPPGLDADRRPSVAQGEGNLRQRAESPTQGHDAIGGSGEDRVAPITQPSGDSKIDVLVCRSRIIAGQQPNGQPTGGPGTACRMLHHPREPAADEHSVALGNAAAQLEGQFRE